MYKVKPYAGTCDFHGETIKSVQKIDDLLKCLECIPDKNGFYCFDNPDQVREFEAMCLWMAGDGICKHIFCLLEYAEDSERITTSGLDIDEIHYDFRSANCIFHDIPEVIKRIKIAIHD